MSVFLSKEGQGDHFWVVEVCRKRAIVLLSCLARPTHFVWSGEYINIFCLNLRALL